MQRNDLEAALIVSCQPVPGGPMDDAGFVTGFALAALAAGAGGLRIESVDYVKAVRAATSAPIIGIVKRDLDDSPVRITPYVADVYALAEAGADVIAFDATDRARPDSLAALVAAAKAAGRLTMADCAGIEDARNALALDVDYVGSTLSGYVGGVEPVEPDFQLIRAMRQLTPHVIAEGRIRTPQQAAAAAEAGAMAVVVGSALTRTEHATSWFREALDHAWTNRANPAPVLAIDIGGTKSMAALVCGTDVVDSVTITTACSAGPDRWLSDIADAAAAWRGRYDRVGLAVTGFVDDGRWSALNPATLGIPDGYPLVATAARVFDAASFAVNDAQAAAWGEHRHGAGRAVESMVFLTISTGIGGGVILDGRLRQGLAGSFGLLRGRSHGDAPLEDEVTGRWFAEQATRAGHPGDAASVFEAAAAGAGWARALVDASAMRIATLCRDIQMTFDPSLIVIGGGIGMAPTYLERIRGHLATVPGRQRPHLAPATLGRWAGAVGVADLARAGATDI